MKVEGDAVGFDNMPEGELQVKSSGQRESAIFEQVRNVTIFGGNLEMYAPKVRNGESVTDVRRTEANSKV